MNRTRATVRAVVPAIAMGAVALAAGPVAAHVTITPTTTAAGARAEVRMEVPHGCEGSATTELAVRLPAQVSDADVETTDRWAADVASDSITFRTDAPLPDALRDQVVFSVRLPDEVGAELVFPVVQRCEEGESAWTEVAEDDASREALDMPAPVIVVTAADASGSDATSAASSPDAGQMTVGAIGVLAAGCVASGAVLLLRRRRA
ncbi:YcnI family protein [Nocardioides hwasunensis]|uniref:YcnI family protein n=1 Tax=Nocardioides hwasunensis TaxID=397258 RepID=A0ABR8MM94_9ACTN|nr:YcnI family protein [Nocardioides hwasunensis]MBD3915930.1 YcnI family protein [Nocardioides hwasunensis]